MERFSIPDEDLEAFFTLFAAPKYSVLVEPQRHYRVVEEDPSDNMFLDCAVAGKAECLVSGDKHLLTLKAFAGVPIVKPSRFLRDFPA